MKDLNDKMMTLLKDFKDVSDLDPKNILDNFQDKVEFNEHEHKIKPSDREGLNHLRKLFLMIVLVRKQQTKLKKYY